MAASQTPTAPEGGVETNDAHFGQIGARPHEHIIRYGDNHVGHLVVIAVEGGLHRKGATAVGGPRQTEVELAGALGLQTGRAIVEIVVLVEGRGTKQLLVGGPYPQVWQQGVRQAERGRQTAHIVRRLATIVAIEEQRIEQPAGDRQPLRLVFGRQRLQHGVAVRMAVHGQVAVQVVEGIVGGIVERPSLCRSKEQGGRAIVLALIIVAVGYLAGSHAVVVERGRPVVFGVGLQRPLLAPVGLELHLSEEVSLAQRLTAGVAVVVDNAGQLAVVVVVVDLSAETAVVAGLAEELQLAVAGIHAAVAAAVADSLRHIVNGIGVVVLGIGVLAHGGKGKAVGEVLLVTHKGTDIAEGARLDLSRQVGTGVAVGQSQRADVQHGRCGGLAGGNENVIVVADDKREMVDIVEGIAREVYLAALTVGEHHAVVTDPCVLGSETAHRDGLHAAGTTVVAQRDTGQAVEGIGHVGDTHAEHIAAVEDMHRGRTLQTVLLTGLCDGDLLQLVHAVGHSVGGLCLRRNATPPEKNTRKTENTLHDLFVFAA